MKTIITILLIFIVLAVNSVTTLAGEPDSDAFVTANFQLQTSYNRVLCVAQDGSCPAEITTAVPCLVDACTPVDETYTIAETFNIVQNAAEAAQPGDLVIIMPGRYRGVQIEETGGEDGAYIHFLGWGNPGEVIIDGVAFPEKDWLRHLFYFIDVHHYIIQNLTFEGSEEGAGLFFSGYFSGTGHFSHHIIVLNVYSHDNNSWGFHSTSTSTLLIQNSVFTNSIEEHGAYISGSGDNVLIRRNIFQGNTSSGLQVNADPQSASLEIFYWLDNTTGDTCGWSEEDADFGGEASWHDLKDCYDSQGQPDLGALFEDGISENIIIEQNVITGNGEAGGAGINMASVRNSIVRNNLIYGNGAAGITCWDNGYAEEKGLDSSEFGCQNVAILNNTIVDETGGRGGLILNNDARNMQVYNNIIIRDRFDTYEIANRSGTGLQTGWNYFTERSIDNAPDTPDEQNSISGISVTDGLGQFRNPSFEPWILEGDDGGYILNPSHPDYCLLPDSTLATAGNPAFAPTGDIFSNPRTGTEIGAVSVCK